MMISNTNSSGSRHRSIHHSHHRLPSLPVDDVESNPYSADNAPMKMAERMVRDSGGVYVEAADIVNMLSKNL